MGISREFYFENKIDGLGRSILIEAIGTHAVDNGMILKTVFSGANHHSNYTSTRNLGPLFTAQAFA